jgi:hypothetical protein
MPSMTRDYRIVWDRPGKPAAIPAVIDDPPRGGVLLGAAPLVPAASAALSAGELAARLARYAGRAARRLPLFGPGRAAVPEPAVCCFGCGRVPSRKSHVSRCPGWVVRSYPVNGAPQTEVYCGRCAVAVTAGCG